MPGAGEEGVNQGEAISLYSEEATRRANNDLDELLAELSEDELDQ